LQTIWHYIRQISGHIDRTSFSWKVDIFEYLMTRMRQFLSFMFCLNCSFSAVFSQDYFQQEVNYRITVALNDSASSLSGYESISYINHAPRSLSYLYFHLWPNAYKNDFTAFAHQQLINGNTDHHFAGAAEHGFIDSLEFRINGKSVNWEYCKDSIDICRIILNEPLRPSDSLVITTPFYVKIPGDFSRFGHVGQSYQITQWYPKPAVYDRLGWHQMPYLDQGEFYSEFGSYDVSITLPEDYVVGATGNLLTEEERIWLEKKAAGKIVSRSSGNNTRQKTIRYTEKNIHDFAWFADKEYKVVKGEVVLSNGHRVTTWAMYPEIESDLWNNAIGYINDAVSYYSQWYGNYPYNNCTAVYGQIEAGGAMEYPEITVVGATASAVTLENYIMHEVGHNWFYGMLGFNERRYPYLDEGFNTFSEFRYMRTKYPGLKLYRMLFDHPEVAKWMNIKDRPYGSYYYYGYLLSARTKSDQPMNLTSADYTFLNYGVIVYFKSALAYNYLLEYLGDEEFNRIMQKFFSEWQFRHPGPEDLRQAFEKESRRDLSWFFDELVNTKKTIDYSIHRRFGNAVLVRNKGQISSPVNLSYYLDGRKRSDWYPGFTGKKGIALPDGKIEKIRLFDSIWLPEIHSKNNSLRDHGPFRWVEPLNLHLIQLLENPDRTEIGILPAVGWNYYNKTMLGVLLYSPLLPQQTFEYQVMPLFATGNHDAAGMGRIALNLYPDFFIFKAMQFSLDARRFGYAAENGASYNRVKGEMLFTLKKKNPLSPVINTLKFSLISADETGSFSLDEFHKHFFLNLDANYTNLTVLNPHSVNLNFEVNNDYVRTSVDMHYTHALKYSKDAIQVRFYASAFLEKEADFNPFYSIRLSGASGLEDYEYEHLYLGRFENFVNESHSDFLARQFVVNEGGFASYDPYAFSDRWLATLGIVCRVPKIPVCLYVNTGTYSGAGQNVYEVQGDKQVSDDRIAYEMGGMIRLGDFLKIYFPALVSHGISQFNEAYTGNYWQTIRYSIDFNAINPFKFKNRLF
jgi:hypothetical protein